MYHGVCGLAEYYTKVEEEDGIGRGCTFGEL
jgi:hypothetical protein